MAETFPCKQNKCQLQLNDVILGMGHLIDPSLIVERLYSLINMCILKLFTLF